MMPQCDFSGFLLHGNLYFHVELLSGEERRPCSCLHLLFREWIQVLVRTGELYPPPPDCISLISFYDQWRHSSSSVSRKDPGYQ